MCTAVPSGLRNNSDLYIPHSSVLLGHPEGSTAWTLVRQLDQSSILASPLVSLPHHPGVNDIDLWHFNVGVRVTGGVDEEVEAALADKLPHLQGEL